METRHIHEILLRDAASWNAFRKNTRGTSTSMRRINLDDADLSLRDLSEIDFAGASFRRANASGADFRNANLSFSDFRDANLEGANLIGADLRGADFRRTILAYVVADKAEILGIRLDAGSTFPPMPPEDTAETIARHSVKIILENTLKVLPSIDAHIGGIDDNDPWVSLDEMPHPANK